MTATFTARSVRTLPAPSAGRVDYFDAKLPGFGLRISASGKRVWFVLYRAGGRLKRFTIGPTTLYELDAARELARDLLHKARTGTDPAIERRAQREAVKAETVDRSFHALGLLP